jgi:hypothetical protein
MPQYANTSGKSGVVSYDTGPDWISVTFKDGSTYMYDDVTPGLATVNTLKQLAASGSGLNAYITKHVKKSYAYRV